MHTAKDDVVGLGVLLREDRQAVRVAASIGELDDLIALVVMSEDEHAWPERRLGRAHTGSQLVRGSVGIPLGERALQPQHSVVLPPGGAPRGVRHSAHDRWGQPGRLATGLSVTELCIAGYLAGLR